MKKKKEKKPEDIIKEITETLFTSLGIVGDFDFTLEDNEASLSLETQDTGIVIGYHGEVLESLQLILSLMVSKRIGSFVRVSIEVGDYKKNRSDWLESLAQRAKERALLEQAEVPLPNLKSWERRIVHLLFQEDQEVLSESVGEGRERTLVIRPRN